MCRTVDMLCEYQYEKSFHSFIFHDDTRDSIDQWVAILEDLQIKGQWYGKEEVKLLIDARSARHLPLRYLFERLSDYNRAYPHLKPPRVRMAYVHHPSVIVLSIYYTLADLMGSPVKVEFFTDHETALDWLTP